MKSSGVDIIWIETISALDKLKAAIDAAKRTGLPTSCTLSFDTDASTMMGVSPKSFVHFCEDNNLTSYGANCGVGPSEMVDTILQIKKIKLTKQRSLRKEIVVSLRIRKEK